MKDKHVQETVRGIRLLKKPEWTAIVTAISHQHQGAHARCLPGHLQREYWRAPAHDTHGGQHIAQRSQLLFCLPGSLADDLSIHTHPCQLNEVMLIGRPQIDLPSMSRDQPQPATGKVLAGQIQFQRKDIHGADGQHTQRRLLPRRERRIGPAQSLQNLVHRPVTTSGHDQTVPLPYQRLRQTLRVPWLLGNENARPRAQRLNRRDAPRRLSAARRRIHNDRNGICHAAASIGEMRTKRQ